MRIIKFREWDGRKMHDAVICQGVSWDLMRDCPTGNDIMQFTGLTDKNGKEIYEGDIMDYGCNRYKPVEFINGCFCICKNTAMPTLMTLYPIIGNIYENPELI